MLNVIIAVIIATMGKAIKEENIIIDMYVFENTFMSANLRFLLSGSKKAGYFFKR